MEIGTGIAIAGIWISVAVFGINERVTGAGAIIGFMLAAIVTVIIAS